MGAVIGLAPAGVALAAGPEYAFVDLHPLDSRYHAGSQAGGLAGAGRQAGYANYSDNAPIASHAAVWGGSPETFVDLHPSLGWFLTVAAGTNGPWQVGWGQPTGAPGPRALLWQGTAASVVDLTPPGVDSAQATGIAGDQVVGTTVARYADDNFAILTPHAVMWTGPGHTLVDLNPGPGQGSRLFGTDGTHQVGDVGHAAVWSGTASSMRLLPEPTGFTASSARGVAGDQVVGYGIPAGAADHALLWSLAGDTVIDLNPAGFTRSRAAATNGRQQVGTGVTPDLPFERALVWNGTPDDYVDLTSLLPPGYASAAAYGIDDAGNIVGSALSPDSLVHAVMWVPVPEPSSLPWGVLGVIPFISRGRRR
jgi:hypothetical protein